jgi:hypothetical protein
MHNLDKQLHRRLPIILTKCIANNRCYLVLKKDSGQPGILATWKIWVTY